MLVKLKDKKWKEFNIYYIFNYLRGKRQVEKSRVIGNIPYYSASQLNNGLTDFISNPTFTIHTNAIIYSTFGDAHYVEKTFSTSDEITILINMKLTQYNSLFICRAINQNKTKYSFGRKAFSNKIGKDKILLPIECDKKENIDWQYMEQYTKSITDKKIDKYIKYAKSILHSLEYKEIEKLYDKEWEEFFIDEIAYIKPGKRLTKADMIKGNKPFIGSSDSNNGITEFTSNTNQSEDFNVLGVNYNGSVVENFYHPYKAIFSDDVKRLSLKYVEGNKYLYLFIKNSILKQKNKYQYAYKFNEKRLKRQKILLPVNKTNKPDYEYMEQYIKNLEYKKIKQYLDYLTVKQK